MDEVVRVKHLKNGKWATINRDDDQIELFDLEEHAKIEASIWNMYIHYDYEHAEKYDAVYINARDRLTLWTEIVKIMYERGMIV